MTKASDNAFPSILVTEGTEPSAPAAGKQRLYIDSTTHHLMRVPSSGTEVDIESGGGGDVATDTIWNAKGDLAVGTGSDTAARLGVGADGKWPFADASQSTGMRYSTMGSFFIPFVAPMGFNPAAASTTSTASLAYMTPLWIPLRMKLRSLSIRVTAGAAGTTNQWGLFDYSSSRSSATKIAGGSGALNSGAGWTTIAAASAPVDVDPGQYMVIFMLATATAPTIALNGVSGQAMQWSKAQTSYTWDDTPDMTTGWTTNAFTPSWALVGDVDGSGNAF